MFGVSSYPKSIKVKNGYYPVMCQHNEVPEIINLLREKIIFNNFVQYQVTYLDSLQGNSSEKSSLCEPWGNRNRDNGKDLKMSPNILTVLPLISWGHFSESRSSVYSTSRHHKIEDKPFNTWKLKDHRRVQERQVSNSVSIQGLSFANVH